MTPIATNMTGPIVTAASQKSLLKWSAMIGTLAITSAVHGRRAYAHDMALTIPSGRTPHELVEVAPTRCPAGHRLGAGQVLVGFGIRPDDARARSLAERHWAGHAHNLAEDSTRPRVRINLDRHI